MQSLRSDLCKAGQRSVPWTLQVARLEADLRIPVSYITIRPPCHLVKPTPCLGLNIWKWKEMWQVKISDSLGFWLLTNPHKAHISLSSHLSASEFVWLSCEWWKLKSYADTYSMWEPLPGSLCPGKARGACTQADLSGHLCIHSASLDTRLRNTEYCGLTWWEATGLVLRYWPRRDGIQPIPRPQEKYFRP